MTNGIVTQVSKFVSIFTKECFLLEVVRRCTHLINDVDNFAPVFLFKGLIVSSSLFPLSEISLSVESPGFFTILI